VPCQSYICYYAEVQYAEPGCALSRDSCPAKTTSAKARKIKNSTRNRLLKKNEPAPDGVAMSELSNSTKKHTSKSHETIPLSEDVLAFSTVKIITYILLEKCSRK
jgi:hypothetical protein